MRAIILIFLLFMSCNIFDTIDPDVEIHGDTKVSEDSETFAHHPAVAYNSTASQYGVVWVNGQDIDELELQFCKMKIDGRKEGSNIENFNSNCMSSLPRTLSKPIFPNLIWIEKYGYYALAFWGGTYNNVLALTMFNFDEEQDDIVVFDVSGLTFGDLNNQYYYYGNYGEVQSNDVDLSPPMFWDGENIILAYQKFDRTDVQSHVLKITPTRIDEDTIELQYDETTDEIRIDEENVNSFYPAMCRTSELKNYGIAWLRFNPAEDKYYICYKSLNEDLEEIAETKEICEVSKNTKHLTIAPLNDFLFLIMWTEPDLEKEEYQLYYTFSNHEQKYLLETEEGNDLFPTAAYIDGEASFVYQNNNEGFYKLYYGSFVPTGELIRRHKLERPTGEARNASLVANPELNELMLVWQDTRDGELRFLPQWQIYFARLNNDGTIKDIN